MFLRSLFLWVVESCWLGFLGTVVAQILYNSLLSFNNHGSTFFLPIHRWGPFFSLFSLHESENFGSWLILSINCFHCSVNAGFWKEMDTLWMAMKGSFTPTRVSLYNLDCAARYLSWPPAPNGSKWLCLIFILATVLKICQHTFISCPMEIAWGRKLFVFICLSFSVSYAASWQYILLRINLENRWESKTELALLRIVLVYLWHPYLCTSTWTNSFQEMKVNPPWIPL